MPICRGFGREIPPWLSWMSPPPCHGNPLASSWADENLVLHKLRFPPDFVAPFSLRCEGGSPFFPPLRRGGRGGGPGTTSHRRFPRSLPLSPFASLSRGEKNRSRPSRLPHHPPYPPFTRGGKGSSPPCEGGT